jgi:hypothetical protein
VLAGESLLVLGIAGTGKTHYVQGIVERLKHSGKRVDVISKTHTASRRAGGATADHWVRRQVLHGSAACDYLWIDECSQVDIGLLHRIAKLCWAGVQFLLSGDFHQFAPICNNWRGSPVPDDALEQSVLLHTMAGGNSCTLTECRRGDRMLFDFYSSLIPGGLRAELPVQVCVAQAKAVFRSSAPARWRNGCLYTVESIDREAKTLTLEGVGSLSFEQVKVWLRLSYAQTYASCQGTEFADSLRLWDCAHRHFSRRHLFVGLSRARQNAQVSLKD